MKTELCSFCLKSGILCSSCRSKLKSGEISEIDLKIAQTLFSLEKTYPSLQDIYFHKAVEANRVLAIVVGKGDVARLLSYGGKILRELGKKVGKRIRVLENGVDDRKFLEDLFAPLSIITINKIWIPDDTTQTRVILRKTRRQSPLINVEALKKIAKELRGITIRVEFAD
ncbi:hypothetical protein KAS14_05570 [Candidatus Bathyarchaeota archaeon]|nr:hypothetical protein [Candidatus Bathyarchaeota archaeon]